MATVIHTSAFPPPETTATQSLPVDIRHQGQLRRCTQDQILSEVPVALEYNGISHAVMMVTPEHLTDFGLGFSLSEQILHRPEELFDIQLREEERGYTLAMTISNRRLTELKQRRRNLTGRTGCGLCGTESLQQVFRPSAGVVAPSVSDAAVQRALQLLDRHQPLQQETGGSHGGAWCDLQGNILDMREDVGRHNALDKLIGARSGNPDWQQGFALISSRASMEMVQKCCAVGIGALVAVSAPTTLAVELAEQANLLLIGFARPGRHVIYHQPEGLV